MANKSIKSAIFKPPYVSQEAYETELLEMEQAGFPKGALDSKNYDGAVPVLKNDGYEGILKACRSNDEYMIVKRIISRSKWLSVQNID